jgi:uncharacterized membrane protein YphA (DoxX/SURF4 family)
VTPALRRNLGLLGRLAVGGVLVYAGATKAAGPSEEFALVISYYRLLPRDLTLSMAAFLPWVELLVGWSLLLGVLTRMAAAAAGGLFGMFLLALASTLARGIELPNCGCFGDALHFTIPQALLFDSCMLGLCWLAFQGGREWLSLDSWASGGYTPGRKP